MANIVLVHGIAQEQLAADVLEDRWVPALAGGVRNAGDFPLADRIRQWRRGYEPTVRMAFYGDCFLSPGSQGASRLDADLSPAETELAEQLASVWLEAAALRASDRQDQLMARRQLELLASLGSETSQGVRAAARPAINALAKLRWFAPTGMALASTFVGRALTQVTRYFSNPGLRMAAQDRVLKCIGNDTRLIIGHSLGTVVAYEALTRCDHVVALITLGSPLGLQSVVLDRLMPQPPRVPTCITQWDNFSDKDDLVAACLDLRPLFLPGPSNVRPTTHPSVDNGSEPHDAVHYLTKPMVGKIVSHRLA